MRYCEQMQAMVNSFDAVMGQGAAAPYTGLARRAMSQHFKSMKEAIVREVKASCEALGEKEGSGGITKGETPRLKMLEQKFRQQRALQHMGIMDPETWRPQRGLPDRSVNILRAWLFEHFLHPYFLSPSLSLSLSFSTKPDTHMYTHIYIGCKGFVTLGLSSSDGVIILWLDITSLNITDVSVG